MELKRVVVTGLGAVTPVGNTPKETWENLLNGVSGAAPITLFDATKFKTQFACEVKNLNVADYLDRKEARKMDRYTQLGLVAAIQAVEDSGMDLDHEDKNRIGVVYGVGIGGIKTFEDEVSYYATHEEDGPKFNPFFIPKMIADIVAGQISIMYGFHGPNYITSSACASSSNALADAFNLIRLGKSNVIVAGGAEAAICEAGVGGFNAMKALSTRNDEPEKASRPFSASRDGFIIGEGAGCLILEELEHAKARGAKIYAEMVGAGMSADAHHITASHPEGLGAKLVMLSALEDAGMKPEEIDYINVHGTSTHVGDISEAKAIKEVFGDAAFKLNISSTKSMTGHLLGAAGAVEAMATILAVQNDIVPPTINHEAGDEDPDVDKYVHPARLYYTINTPSMVKNAAYLFSNEVAGKTWTQISGQYTEGAVTATTQSVIMKDQVQYAVGRLDIKAQVKTGVTILDSGSGIAETADKDPQPVAVPDAGYTHTGVLIGGQKQVDWQFKPVTSSAEYTIFDDVTSYSTAAKSGVFTDMVHTLALETATDGLINVALEFVNTGKDFYGIDHKLIPAGAKFYLVAQLDPRASNTEHATNQAAADNKVFKQDFTTTAVMTIGATSLAKAYNIIPDLRSPKLEFGLSVNLEWQSGITFTQEF